MQKFLFAAFLLIGPLALAQINTSGPGVLSGPTGGIGRRSGQDVDMRYFVNATGVYDTGLTPLSITKDGKLLQPGGLFGIEAGLGAYGRHTFRRSAVGLDYTGNFRHYGKGSSFDGSNQQLGFDYTIQKTRRLYFDFTAMAGTQNFGTALGLLGGTADPIIGSGSLLFDNRMNFYQGGMNTRYALSGRTTISMGGTRYAIHRESAALVGVRGYTLQGNINHRLSRNTIVGANYQHMHYDFPRAFGEVDIDTYYGSWSTTFARSWNVAVSAGMFKSQVQGVQSTALDPVIAELLGIGTVSTIFYRENVIPMGQGSLTKTFRRASWSANYSRIVSPGNGVFLTSRQESYGSNYAYTGLRRISFSILGNVVKMRSLGQDLVPFTQFNGTATIGFNLGKGLNLTTAYARRYQDIQTSSFRRDSSRISIGIYFSPGEVPVSFH